MRTLLVDADSLVYAAGRANEREIQWDHDLWTLHAHLDPAIARFDDDVATLKERMNADRVVMALSDYTDPWRKRIMPTYKSNRKDVRKPVVFRPLREYVHEAYDTVQRRSLEGDDVLGILATNPVRYRGEKIVVSLDKDMNTVPGLHLNLKKAQEQDDWTIREVSREAADRYHLTQTLTGDATDGYAGCPGVGPVKAAKLLDGIALEECWSVIVEAYQKAGLGADEALRTARVARILRHGEYHYRTKEVRLWNPVKAA